VNIAFQHIAVDAMLSVKAVEELPEAVSGFVCAFAF
jgi:hypothetical protein